MPDTQKRQLDKEIPTFDQAMEKLNPHKLARLTALDIINYWLNFPEDYQSIYSKEEWHQLAMKGLRGAGGKTTAEKKQSYDHILFLFKQYEDLREMAYKSIKELISNNLHINLAYVYTKIELQNEKAFSSLEKDISTIGLFSFAAFEAADSLYNVFAFEMAGKFISHYFKITINQKIEMTSLKTAIARINEFNDTLKKAKELYNDFSNYKRTPELISGVANVDPIDVHRYKKYIDAGISLEDINFIRQQLTSNPLSSMTTKNTTEIIRNINNRFINEQ